jgi:NAD(P)-dependent dehydrogenase (short-subunit alcohol dehydrogenase family)
MRSGPEDGAPMSATKSAFAPFDLAGKVAFVPGGYGGIGAAIARGLARHGAEVVVAGRDVAKAEALAAEFHDEGLAATGIVMDAHSVASIRMAVDTVVGSRGHLDILVNCVGIQREQALLDVTEDAYDEVYEINLKAAMFLGQAVARHQVAAGNGGRHVHLLSVRAQLGLRDRGYSAYCSTKGGLVMLVRQHAMELARHGITVNGVAPTVVRTVMANHWLANPVTHKQIVDRIPLGRVGEPDDVVGPALLFCAPAGGFVTGQILYVDGGITASQ